MSNYSYIKALEQLMLGVATKAVLRTIADHGEPVVAREANRRLLAKTWRKRTKAAVRNARFRRAKKVVL